MSTPTRGNSSREDVQKFLDSLDDYTPTAATAAQSPTAPVTRPAATRPVQAGARTAAGAAFAPSQRVPIARPAASAASLPAGPTAKPAPPAASAVAPPAAPALATPAAVNTKEDAQSMLDFLDEITQRSSTPTQPVAPAATSGRASVELGKRPGVLPRSGSKGSLASAAAGAGGAPGRRSTDAARPTSSASTATTAAGRTPVTSTSARPASPASVTTPAPAAQAPAASGGWGWTASVWSSASTLAATASNVVQQARTVAEEQVKAGGLGEGLMKMVGENEQAAKKWSQGVVEMAKGAHLDQIGKDLKSTTIKSLTDLLNAVAPPISEHEVIEVTLSHDMIGYDGIETLVYRGLSKIMDQNEGGTLIVNPRNAPEDANAGDDERNLNIVDGLPQGWKKAELELETLISASFKSESSTAAHDRSASSASSQAAADLTVPVTRCPIYLRIQPVLAPLPYHPSSSSSAENDNRHLFFAMILRDPTHALTHTSLSQSMPASWLDIPFEENEWVEDVMVDVIRRSVETLGKEYTSHRARAQRLALERAREDARRTLDSDGAGAGGDEAKIA